MPTGVYKRTKEHGTKISQARKGYPNYNKSKGADKYNWKGDNVGYFALHAWIKRNNERN